ncbi:hypothetical protein DB347_21530 [Opitutaceae bacterium EW11]|nr:hypothetical protein DB347_21530 [Opitutaceae bacterium EW11]
MACAACALVSTAAMASRREGGSKREETVKVLSVSMPQDEPEELLVRTDHGTYGVSEKLTHHLPRGEQWFLFRIGCHYHVSVHGRDYEGFWGHARPVIETFTPVDNTKLADLSVAP